MLLCPLLDKPKAFWQKHYSGRIFGIIQLCNLCLLYFWLQQVKYCLPRLPRRHATAPFRLCTLLHVPQSRQSNFRSIMRGGGRCILFPSPYLLQFDAPTAIGITLLFNCWFCSFFGYFDSIVQSGTTVISCNISNVEWYKCSEKSCRCWRSKWNSLQQNTEIFVLHCLHLCRHADCNYINTALYFFSRLYSIFYFSCKKNNS